MDLNVKSWPGEAKAWWKDARANPLFLRGLIGAGVIVALDQLTKYWIVHVVELPRRIQIDLSAIFDLTYVENRGASFGLLAGGMASRILLSLISTAVATGLMIWLGRLKRPVPAVGIAFIVGGALGNLYDRIAYGFVVDFLDFSGLYFPWVFNIADASINIGVALLILDAWQTRDQAGDKKTEPAD